MSTFPLSAVDHWSADLEARCQEAHQGLVELDARLAALEQRVNGGAGDQPSEPDQGLNPPEGYAWMVVPVGSPSQSGELARLAIVPGVELPGLALGFTWVLVPRIEGQATPTPTETPAVGGSTPWPS